MISFFFADAPGFERCIAGTEGEVTAFTEGSDLPDDGSARMFAPVDPVDPVDPLDPSDPVDPLARERSEDPGNGDVVFGGSVDEEITPAPPPALRNSSGVIAFALFFCGGSDPVLPLFVGGIVAGAFLVPGEDGGGSVGVFLRSREGEEGEDGEECGAG